MCVFAGMGVTAVCSRSSKEVNKDLKTMQLTTGSVWRTGQKMFSTGRLCVINYDTYIFLSEVVLCYCHHFSFSTISADRVWERSWKHKFAWSCDSQTEINSSWLPQALNGHCSCYAYSIFHVHQQTWLSTSTCSDCEADCLVFHFQNSSCGSFSCDYTYWCPLCVSLTFLFFGTDLSVLK